MRNGKGRGHSSLTLKFQFFTLSYFLAKIPIPMSFFIVIFKTGSFMIKMQKKLSKSDYPVEKYEISGKNVKFWAFS